MFSLEKDIARKYCTANIAATVRDGWQYQIRFGTVDPSLTIIVGFYIDLWSQVSSLMFMVNIMVNLKSFYISTAMPTLVTSCSFWQLFSVVYCSCRCWCKWLKLNDLIRFKGPTWWPHQGHRQHHQGEASDCPPRQRSGCPLSPVSRRQFSKTIKDKSCLLKTCFF